MKPRLDAELDFDVDELLDLLNESPERLALPSEPSRHTNPFIRRKPSRPTRTKEAAAELQKHLRDRIDVWIASGVEPDGRETPGKRSISRVEVATYRAREGKPDGFLRDWYWFSKKIEGVVRFQYDKDNDVDKGHVHLTLREPNHRNPSEAESEAGILLLKLLMTDARLRIAKCRNPKCEEYFLLPEMRHEKTYMNGTYCSTLHNRAVSAARRTKERRASARKSSSIGRRRSLTRSCENARQAAQPGTKIALSSKN